jgi:hypothetical protein
MRSAVDLRVKLRVFSRRAHLQFAREQEVVVVGLHVAPLLAAENHWLELPARRVRREVLSSIRQKLGKAKASAFRPAIRVNCRLHRISTNSALAGVSTRPAAIALFRTVVIQIVMAPPGRIWGWFAYLKTGLEMATIVIPGFDRISNFGLN